MKRLHRTLLLGLPLPFAAAFGTLMFLLLMQFLIRYLPELVGRGLPAGALVELVAYNLAYMVTLAVPMAWLIAQIAVFGRLSESRGYLVARSAGVSLWRLAWPVAVVGACLAGGMAYFNNEMLPEANYRMNGLWRDIRVSRPGFALTAGTFYTGVDGYAIRADSIPPGASGTLLGVTVYETRSEGGGEAVLTAARARLQTQYGGQRLSMLLEDGEVHRREGGPAGTDHYERLAFGRYRMAFDLSTLTGFARRAEGGGRTDRSMRTSDMVAVVDSLDRVAEDRADSVAAAIRRGGATPGDAGALGFVPVVAVAGDPAAADSTAPRLGADRAVLAGLSDRERGAVYDLAARRAQAVRSAAETAAQSAEWEGRQADRYRVEIYKKNSIALACLVFVLVGVPLGLSVARAGVGLVASLAVFVFLFYWVTLVQGEKLADREMLPPWLGMWAANAIVGLLGSYLFAREALDPAWADPVRALAGRFSRRD
ncbi:MAG TPA: LptF/LptG family permease [Rubricoccaceae bacterium]